MIPSKIGWAAAFSGAALLWVILWIGFSIDVLLAWLFAINLVAVLAYGYDKSIAGSGHVRLPEKLLLALATTGGSIGALIGMRIFHHKTSKTSFQRRYWFIVIIQAGVLLLYWFVLKPMLA